MTTSTTPITAGSGTNIAVESDASFASGGLRQLFGLVNPDATRPPNDPDGTIQVSPEASTLFLDDFSGTLSTYWALSGTVPTSSAGNATTNEGTTASAVSYGRTTEAFLLRAATYMQYAWIVALETTASVTNVTRWWGYGTNAATPTSAAPITNGAVFLLDTDGSLKAATYSGGTRTVAATLTKPTDGLQHRYAIYYRQSRVYWVMDGVTVATTTFPNLAVATGLYGIFGAANASTAPAAHSTSYSSFTAADGAANAHPIADGLVPNRQATVKPASTAAVAADTALVVGLHPTSPLPAGTNALGSVTVSGTPTVSITGTNTPTLAGGTNLVGAVQIGAMTKIASTTVSSTTNAAVVMKASAGDLQTLLVVNTAASTQHLKLYNATSVTLGTTAAVISIPIAAGAVFNPSLGPSGQRFTTGVAYAVTGAAALNDNTAGAGGVQVVATVA